jgi:hypothetical protein
MNRIAQRNSTANYADTAKSGSTNYCRACAAADAEAGNDAEGSQPERASQTTYNSSFLRIMPGWRQNYRLGKWMMKLEPLLTALCTSM